MPKLPKEYLVTKKFTEDNLKSIITISTFVNGEFVEFTTGYVVAWMELPEIYET